MTRWHVRPPILLSYAAFVLVGVSAGVSGVLLVAQMRDYGVDRATIGTTFFTISAGYVMASLSAGALIHRFGIRVVLIVGGGMFVLSALYLAVRPPFLGFVLVQLVQGYALGMLESALNAYLAALPDATTLLNRLHAFFGVGALLGPALAAWITGFASWTVVWLVLAVLCVPLTAGFVVAYRGPRSADPAADATGLPAPAGGSLLRAALRERGVLLGAAMLAVYVGLEIGVGDWAFSYLVQARAMSGSLAGYSVSGYWLGLTLGRFLISPIAMRIGVTTVRMMYACLAGVAATATLAWLSPTAVLTSAALLLLGFFLGPIFPTTMGSVAMLTSARLAPTAIGVLNAASLLGGAALPWLAGTIAQSAGIWILLPYAVTLAALQFVVWWPLAGRIRAPGEVKHGVR